MRALTIGLSLLLAATASAAQIKRGDIAAAVFGDEATLKSFMSATEITTQRLHHRSRAADWYALSGYTRGAAMAVPPSQVAKLRKLFSDSKSYTWHHVPDEHGLVSEKACTPDYGLLLTLRDGQRVVQIALCFQCDLFAVFVGEGAQPRRVNVEEDFDFVRPQLVEIARSLFPHDEDIQALQHRRPNQALQPTAGRSENYEVELENRKDMRRLALASGG
jgi:hypothetical protein